PENRDPPLQRSSHGTSPRAISFQQCRVDRHPFKDVYGHFQRRPGTFTDISRDVLPICRQKVTIRTSGRSAAFFRCCCNRSSRLSTSFVGTSAIASPRLLTWSIRAANARGG